jgi:hypothetical protein
MAAPEPSPPPARLVRATVAFAGVVGFTALSQAVGVERAYLAVTGCRPGGSGPIRSGPW